MLAGYDLVFLDLDGVVRVGDEPVAGADRVVSRLQADHEVYVLTNDSRSTRREHSTALRDMGIHVDPERVVTSGVATARYLRDHGLETAFVIGGSGLRAELDAVGVDAVGPAVDVDAVVVGLDETVTYDDLTAASRLIDDGAAFVATNVDRSYPTPEGIAPSTGALVSAVRTATATDPAVVGKPEPTMFELVLDGHDAADAVMVGDNLESDVAGAHRAGIDAVLYAPEDVPDAVAPESRPDAVVTALSELLGDA